jgi:hypothetical protein
MSEMRIYVIMRGAEIVTAFSSPATAAIYLMGEPSGLRLKSVIVRDMQGVPLHSAAPREDEQCPQS